MTDASARLITTPRSRCVARSSRLSGIMVCVITSIALMACASTYETPWYLTEMAAETDPAKRLPRLEAVAKRPDCDDACKQAVYTDLSSMYAMAKRPADELAALDIASQACEREVRSGKSKYKTSCAQEQKRLKAAMARANPETDENFAILESEYKSNPWSGNATPYIAALRIRGRMAEAQRENDFQLKIMTPIGNVTQKIYQKSLENEKGLEGSAKDQINLAQSLAMMELYTGALDATTKSGLTQHDAFLTNTLEIYRESVSMYKDRVLQAPVEKKEESMFGAALGAILSGVAVATPNVAKAGMLSSLATAVSGGSAPVFPNLASMSGSTSPEIFAQAFQTIVSESSRASAPSTQTDVPIAPELSAAISTGEAKATVAAARARTGEPQRDGSGSCPTNLAHVRDQLPEYDHPELRQTRAAILNESVRETYASGIRSGRTPVQLHNETLAQMKTVEIAKGQAKDCLAQLSVSPTILMQQLESGTYRPEGGVLQDKCVVNYVMQHYYAVGMQATADAFACLTPPSMRAQLQQPARASAVAAGTAPNARTTSTPAAPSVGPAKASVISGNPVDTESSAVAAAFGSNIAVAREPPATAAAKAAQPPSSQVVRAAPTRNDTPSPVAASSKTAVVTAQPTSATQTIYLPGQRMTGTFTSDEKTGLVSGVGQIVWDNGNRFDGQLVAGQLTGEGRFKWANGQEYEGQWANDNPNGRGVLRYPGGDRYEGEIKDGQPHGIGTTQFTSGDQYSGQWTKGRQNGKGRYQWKDGSYWVGEFRDGARTENGQLVRANSAVSAEASAGGTGVAPIDVRVKTSGQ